MSTDNVTPIRPGAAIPAPNTPHELRAEEPESWASLPGFPSIEVHYCPRRYSLPMAEYCGTAEALIASGIVTGAMLAINAPKGSRHKRIDKDGDQFRLVRYWRATAGGTPCAPYRWYRITFMKPRERLEQLPGCQLAIAAYERASAWQEARRAKWERPSLRLVVDNQPL